MSNINKKVAIVGGGLAGSEAALFLANAGIEVYLYEMRPHTSTPVHKTSNLAELVCSNSFKSKKRASAAGMLKYELERLNSPLYKIAKRVSVDAGGAMAVDRTAFCSLVTKNAQNNEKIVLKNQIIKTFDDIDDCDAILITPGPLCQDDFAHYLQDIIGVDYLNFYDAAAPIVETESLDYSHLFSQDRYENKENGGDYLNCPLDKEQYENFIDELRYAKQVIVKDFEKSELFQACQPIEEIAKAGIDAPRYGCMKPVGLIDPKTGKRPYAVVQLRAENNAKNAYNLVGFQTNLTFSEQKRIFCKLPGLKDAQFLRYGVMHKNIFLDAPKLINKNFLIKKFSDVAKKEVFVAGQFMGTEGYLEAVRGGNHAAISIISNFNNIDTPIPNKKTIFGSLIDYISNPECQDYQPMHVNFGLIEPLSERIKKKDERYELYASRGQQEFDKYIEHLKKMKIYGL